MKHLMRKIFTLTIFLMLTSGIAATESPGAKIVVCDHAQFEATVQIAMPSEFEIELTGEMFLAPGKLRILAINSLTNEELFIIADKSTSKLYFCFPDTLNGVVKELDDDSPFWNILASGFSHSTLKALPDMECSELSSIAIKKVEYPGNRYESASGTLTEIWWDSGGNPKRITFIGENNQAQLNITGFEQDIKATFELFEISDEFTLRQADEDEVLNPFQL